MRRPYPTARDFAEALAPAVKWRWCRTTWIVKGDTISVIRDARRQFVVMSGLGSIRVGASRVGIQRARRWLLFMAGEDAKVARFVAAAGLEQAP